MDGNHKNSSDNLNRRNFLQLSTAAAVGGSGAAAAQRGGWITVDEFDRADSLYHGDGWETLNPGYWKIEDRALRRKLKNVGDQNPITYYPYHVETHGGGRKMDPERDRSLPFGMIWRRDWKLTGNYSVRASFTVKGLHDHPPDAKDDQDKPGWAVMGLCFGGATLFESRQGGSNDGAGAWMALWRDSGEFGIFDHGKSGTETATGSRSQWAGLLKTGDKIAIEVVVSGLSGDTAEVTARLLKGDSPAAVVKVDNVNRKRFSEGFIGIVGRGLADFEVNRVEVLPEENQPIKIVLNDCHVCYPVGPTLERVDGKWTCKFVAMFRNDGKKAELRISDSPNPSGGWAGVPVAGSAAVINSEFRRNTSIITATLPFNPGEKTQYYTIWKDGVDVTADPRIDNPEMVAPGTGMVEPGTKTGAYVGRLPQLTAPYHIAGLGCHAIHAGSPNLPEAGKFQANWVHDQPTPRAYEHLEDYKTQIMDWDDDIWYLELLFPPPSTDDAYRVITTSICGPTSRWQFMRHWNILNPGDHDFGMDDVKGPEQIVIRNVDGLGQDMHYMRRNYQINIHLCFAVEEPSPVSNPKLWRRWRMPDGDFTFLVLDARRWRTSQYTDMWQNWGWGHKKNLYRRQDPTRTLLGEEQFAWLQQIIRNEPSPLILLTGINCMHTIYTGVLEDEETKGMFAQRDRVAADYAGWVTAGCDRVIELMGSRQGVVSVFGDIHIGSIVENPKHGVIECSFGPIGRTGGRRPKEGFGHNMTDFEGRDVVVHAFYQQNYCSPDLKPIEGPTYWNFLQVDLDPRPADPTIGLRVRNIVDAPSETPRGGGFLERTAAETGRKPASKLPEVTVMADADVRIATEDGRPIQGTRSTGDGKLRLSGLIDVQPGTRVVLTATRGEKAEAQIVTTAPA